MQNRKGTQAQFEALYPPGYNGIGGCDIDLWPDILLPGEIGFCTDTRRIFMGNLNGEYVEIVTAEFEGIVLQPKVWDLPPSATYTPVVRTDYLPDPVVVTMEYDYTPFFNFLYGITDSVNPNWTLPGPTFSRNGELQITAIDPAAVLPPVVPPFPPTTHATVNDVGTEINIAPSPYDVSFIAQYNSPTTIEILYKHDFPTNLTLSTSTLRWLPF